MKKQKWFAWYLPKKDTIVELDAKITYCLIVQLIRWDSDFPHAEYMFLGNI